MDLVPKSSIKSFCLGDVLTGQDGNKYIVCDEAGIMYWKPHVAGVSNVTNVTVQVVAPTKPTPTTHAKPIKKVKEVKEKYYWKDNEKKPKYDGDYNNRLEMEKSLKPKVSPNKFPAGYVWTTKFSNISYVVDTEYKGYSTTMSRFWDVVGSYLPPCLDANDYPYEYVSGEYYVDYDEQGNKFWCFKCGDDEESPLQCAYKFVKGTTRTIGVDDTYVSRRDDDGVAYWGLVQDDCDSDDE